MTLTKHLQKEINQLQNLRKLHLVNNKFSEFPSIFQLRYLRSLHLEMNSISIIPGDIGKRESNLREKKLCLILFQEI